MPHHHTVSWIYRLTIQFYWSILSLLQNHLLFFFHIILRPFIFLGIKWLNIFKCTAYPIHTLNGCLVIFQMYSVSMGYLISISVLGFLFNMAIIILFLAVKKVKQTLTLIGNFKDSRPARGHCLALSVTNLLTQ